MIQRRSNVGSGFRKDWLVAFLPPPSLSTIFFRLTKFVNLWHTVILFHRRVKKKLRVCDTFLYSTLSCYTSSVLNGPFKLGS